MTAVRQKQTSAHPDDAMLVYDNVETSNSREISKRRTNKLTFIKKGNDYTGLSGTAS